MQDILYDDVFALYTEYPELLDIISCFTGPNIMGMHSMLINKPPGTTQHPPHQVCPILFIETYAQYFHTYSCINNQILGFVLFPFPPSK